MLYQLLIFLLTPASSMAKKYGFLYQSISLEGRYKRCRSAWLPHLKKCQDIFLQVAQKVPNKKRVVILGSAHLHEIPFHLLSQNFEEIILVDIIHPLKHRWLKKRCSKVDLIEMDLSGALASLDRVESLEELHRLIKDLQKQSIFLFEADLIVSANVLSQLALLPIDAIEKKIERKLSVEEKDTICTAFAESHLQNLRRCRGHKLIYCDRQVLYKDPQGQLIYEGSYPVSFKDWTPLDSWIWNIAPLKEASKEYSIEMKIESYQGFTS